MVDAGSLYDWLGTSTPVVPEWGRGYRVVSDEEVGWRRESRENVRAQLKAGPHSPLRVLKHLPPSPAWLLPDEDLTQHDRLMRVRLGYTFVPFGRLTLAGFAESVEAYQLLRP